MIKLPKSPSYLRKSFDCDDKYFRYLVLEEKYVGYISGGPLKLSEDDEQEMCDLIGLALNKNEEVDVYFEKLLNVESSVSKRIRDKLSDP